MTPPPTTPTPRLNMGELNMRECPFCASLDVDPEGWASHNPETGENKTGPACDDCGASAESVERWNTRPRTEGRGDDPVCWAILNANRSLRSGALFLTEDGARRHATANYGDADVLIVQPLYASPIREPEISRPDREAVAKIIDPWAMNRAECDPETEAAREEALSKADAILNLAPVGGRGEEGSARADLSPASRSPDQHSAGWKSACCEGERCFCGAPAERKVGETLFDDDPTAWRELFGKRVVARHELTAYVCFDHFAQMMGPASVRLDELAALSGAQRSEDDHGEE